jgi:hypothetical protein
LVQVFVIAFMGLMVENQLQK